MYSKKRMMRQATISGLADFLLNDDLQDGESDYDFDYDERALKAHEKCKEVLLRYDNNEESELYDAIYNLMSEYEKIYMELGLRCGLMLKKDIQQVTITDKPEENNNYDNIRKRINLQDIGAYIRNGDSRNKVFREGFEEREVEAYNNLEQEIRKHINGESMKAVENVLSRYTAVKEEVQFSLGMKAGAQLLLQLVSNGNHDW